MLLNEQVPSSAPGVQELAMEQFNQRVCDYLGRGMGDGATLLGSGIAICASLFLAMALGFI